LSRVGLGADDETRAPIRCSSSTPTCSREMADPPARQAKESDALCHALRLPGPRAPRTRVTKVSCRAIPRPAPRVDGARSGDADGPCLAAAAADDRAAVARDGDHHARDLRRRARRPHARAPLVPGSGARRLRGLSVSAGVSDARLVGMAGGPPLGDQPALRIEAAARMTHAAGRSASS
jgi:hypothetical protein